MANALIPPDTIHRPPVIHSPARDRGAVGREENADRAGAAGRAPTAEKLAAVLLLLAGVTILMAIITGEALFPVAYTTSHNTISDLGSTWQPGNIVREPSATIFNTAMIITGLMIAAAAASFWRATRSRSVSIALLLVGVGLTGVGIFHGTEIGGHFSNAGVHPLFATLTFVAGGCSAILAYRVTASPFRHLSAGLGLISLLSLILSGPLGDSSLGLGGVERWVAYPVILWLIAFGSYLLGRGSGTREHGFPVR